ncbi:hypothetical protein GDO78_021226 [Eleutherodactylus coqui]|uniref:Uncharacterized protein n=1 Tax=Eleutherodactylus coqui TaxID=57060 RepID=A0A8J6EMB2_ELECQ|nr:hypothetical protein GDO78_021226 [Eleutherodactylus coqui]
MYIPQVSARDPACISHKDPRIYIPRVSARDPACISRRRPHLYILRVSRGDPACMLPRSVLKTPHVYPAGQRSIL